MLHPDQPHARRAPSRASSTGTPGAGRAPPPRARSRTGAGSGRSRWRTSASVSKFFRSPMWWPTHARPSFARRERVLQLGPAGEQVPAAVHRQRQRAGHEAARAAQEHRTLLGHAHDGVVGARLDRAVVQEEEVGDVGEPRARVVVLVGDRLVGDVAARHHERLARRQPASRWWSGEYGSITPSSGAPGATDGATRAPGRLGASTIGRAGDSSSSSRGRAHRHQVARRRGVGGHQREWLVLAVLARAQLRHRVLVLGQAGEVEAAEPLDGDDRALPERPRCRLDRIGRARVVDRSRRPRTRAARAGRSQGRRSAGRGSAGPPGPRTRRGRPAHMSKPAIVVFGRSYGMSRTIVNRGPQLVQFVNG